jgi:hypothetical protein
VISASVQALRLRCVRVLCAAAALLSAAWPANAQSRNVGAPFLLLPVGAESAGQGEATVADTALGTESLWWNAAGLGRMRKREIAVHYSATVAANSYMIVGAFPSKVLGTLAAAVYDVNLGDQQATDEFGNPTGTSTNHYYMLAASYASPIGRNFSAGVTAKYVALRFLCSGCDVAVPQLSGHTAAFDFGAQYIVPITLPVTLGLSVRNLGQPLQVKDEQQADPLPRIVQAGAHVTLPIDALKKNEASLEAMGDVFVSPAYARAAANLGLGFTYKKQLILRGGYKSSNGNEGSKGTFTAGLGIRQRGITFDLAREFDSASSGFGQPPTFVSLRFLF